jgi:hypothetical protein
MRIDSRCRRTAEMAATIINSKLRNHRDLHAVAEEGPILASLSAISRDHGVTGSSKVTQPEQWLSS